MRFFLTAAAVVAGLTACSPSIAAPAQPRTFEAVPLYPGMTKTGQQPTVEGGEVLMDWNDPIPFVSGVTRTYTVAATPEQLHEFYLGKLGGKIGYGSEDGHENVKPNGSTPVIVSLHEYGFDNEMTIDNRQLLGATKRATLTQARKPLPGGKWVQESQFQWIIRDATGDLRSFNVSFHDEGLAKNWASYAPRTVVEITVNQFRQ